MGHGLAHHYAGNRHHPEHFQAGISGMTLIDLVEMLADWKAATERHDDGSLARSLTIQQARFGISPQIMDIPDQHSGGVRPAALTNGGRRR